MFDGSLPKFNDGRDNVPTVRKEPGCTPNGPQKGEHAQH